MLRDILAISLILLVSLALGFGAFKAKIADPVSVVLICIGAMSVYGSAKILRLLKKEVSDKNILIVKFIGLLVACIGIFKILQII
jgi:hypothetical protein